VPLFNTQRRLAILPNIGPLVLPTTKAQLQQSSHPRPVSLFSHNDQQNTWQALGPEGTKRGWGGRIGDRLAAGNSRAAFTAISASGNAVFLSGDSVRQYQLGTNGATRMAADSAGRTYGSVDVTAALERIVSRSRGGHVLEADLAEHPDDAYLCYQIGKDAAVYDEHELAEHFFSRALTLAEPDAPWRFDLVARRLFVLKRLGQHAEALKLATLEQIHCAESPDVFFALGDVLLDWAVNNPAQAAPLLAKAETAWLRCLAIGERPDIAGAVQGRGGRLAAHNLALVYEFSARPEMAARLRAQFGLDTRQLLG
jgi:hypothetical protein